MQPSMKYFNSVEAAKILNVNVSTIKRWTQEGKLECVKTPGGHRKFATHHLAKFLEKNKTKTTKANLFPVENEKDLQVSTHILKKDYVYLADYLFKQAHLCDRNAVQRVLNGLYMGQTPIYEIYDKLLTPVLYHVGDLWERGDISVAEEHFTTQTIRDCLIRLQGLIQLPAEQDRTAFCLMMSTEFHDLALKMVDHILEIQGYKVYYSGPMTPSLKIEQIFKKYKPNRVYISSTVIMDENLTQAEFDKICYVSAENNAKVYVGGQGFDILDYSHPAVVKRLHTFEEVYMT